MPSMNAPDKLRAFMGALLQRLASLLKADGLTLHSARVVVEDDSGTRVEVEL